MTLPSTAPSDTPTASVPPVEGPSATPPTEAEAAAPAPNAPTQTSVFDAAAQRVFIEALAETGSVKDAARRAGVSRMTAYRQRHAPDAHAFRAGWSEALARAVAMLADVALSRAIDGVEEPVFWKGEEIGTRTRYNDRLLMFLLRERGMYNPHHAPDPQRWHETVPKHNLVNYVGALEAIAPTPHGAEAEPGVASAARAAARAPGRAPRIRSYV